MTKKYHTPYRFKHIYEFYKGATVKGMQLDYKTFVKVCSEYNKGLMDKVLVEAKEVKFHVRTGYLRIRKKKTLTKVLKIDWAMTKLHNIKMFHLNEHRDGFNYRFYWRKTTSNIKNRTLYTFIPCRTAKRTLARILKNNDEIDYFV